MPQIALTDAAVKKLKAEDGKQIDYFDKHYPGLCLRLGARSRTWFYLCRVGGKLRRHQLGSYPDKSLADARDLWRAAREQVQAGKPPRATPRSRDAIETVISDWLKRDQQSNSTYPEVKRAFDTVIIPAWSGRLITSIDRRDVLDILDPIADRGKIGRANKLHAYINRLMVWSVGRGILPANPMAELPKPGDVVVRDRALSDPEIVALWKATKIMGWPYGSIVRLLLLTLARRDEIAALELAEIDRDAACIRLPKARTKNDEARIIPLTPLCWRLVNDGPRMAGSPYVFTSPAGKPPAGWSKAKAEIDRLMGVNQGWRLHDLRRTGATGLERLGVTLPVTEAVPGHTSGTKGGIVGVYQQHNYEPEKRDALNRWSARVLELVA